MSDEEYIKFFEEMSEEEYMKFLSEYGEINILDNGPTVENFTVKVLRGNEVNTTGYAKLGDTLVLEYTAQNCTEDLTVIFNGEDNYVLKDLTDSTDVKLQSLGEDKYSLSKVFGENDTTGPISISFTDGNLQWNVSISIVYDIECPTLSQSTRIEYGSLDSKIATIYDTPSDNWGIADVSIWINEEWQSISGVKNKEEFSYVVNAKGTYKIKVTDLAGNSIIKEDIEIAGGNVGAIVRKLPNKITYITNEDISLVGGYLKVTNTFGETIQDENGKLVCFCEDGCECEVDGVCTPTEECSKCEYVIPMELALITAVKEESTNDNITNKIVKLRYGTYETSFEISVEDTNKYNINLSPNSGNISDDESITVTVEVEKVKGEYEDITNMWYTWSTISDNIGKEVYTASFGEDIGVFSYEDIEGSTKSWEYDEVNEFYKSGYIGYGKDVKTSSKKRIIIDTNDENEVKDKSGVISFEYKTNSPSDDMLKVSINGEEVLTRDGKYDWKGFSKQVTSSDGKYIIDLSFERSGATSGSSKDYVAIKNLTFTGEKRWKALPEDGKVTLSDENAVGINNYLHIKVDNATESIVKCSGNFEYKTTLTGIAIQTVPDVTVYYVDESKSQESINVNGGEITLKYSKGNKKIPISTDNNVIKVKARPINDIIVSAEETISSNKWYDYIDLRGSGVWDIRVAYTDNESGITYEGAGLTFYDYYTITVNNQEERSTNVNSPSVVKGMVPVKWVETDRTYYEYSLDIDGQISRSESTNTEGFWLTTTENDVEWYDYNTQTNKMIWANVMLKDEIEIREVPDPKDSKLTLDNLAGKRIDAHGSMFVWIPRFSYKDVTTGSKLFDIKWSKSTTDTEGYDPLPAFTYENKELTGFWMAKYEASKENGIVEIKPDKVSNFGDITVDKAYEYSANIVDEEIYGITGSAISHLVTMSEWDAIVILTNSSYASLPNINPETRGGNTHTGYGYDASGSGSIVFGESDSSSKGSTTFNMSGIFDMFGGANEIVSVYIGEEQTDKPSDMERLESVSLDKMKGNENWLASKYTYQGNDEYTASNGFKINIVSDEGEKLLVMRGENAVDDVSEVGTTKGIFTITIGEYDPDGWGIPYVGFRPSILVTEKSTTEPIELEQPFLKIKDKAEHAKYAGDGDVIELTIASTDGVVDIRNMKINGKDPINGGTSNEVTSKGYTFSYKVESGDTNGKVEISYEYKAHSASSWNPGRTDVNTIYVDTNAKNINVGWENNKITITVKSDGEGDSGITDIKYVKKTDGSTPSNDELENGTSIVLGDGGTGTIKDSSAGDYYIYIKDEAGNTTIEKITISSGSGEGEFEINDIIPKLKTMAISVLRDGGYVENPSHINRLETVKLDMTFDHEIVNKEGNARPVVYIAGSQVTVTSDTNDKKIWTAICNRIGNQYAYEDIPISISDYEYYGNKGETVNETFDDGTDENPGVKIPYDGSLVKIEVSDPEIGYDESGNVISIESVITFSDPVYRYTMNGYIIENTVISSSSNLDVSSINLTTDKIHITNTDITADISVSDSDVAYKKVVKFENIEGTGNFGFSIDGATYNDNLSEVENFVAKDIYGNPNEIFTSGGNYNIPISVATVYEVIVITSPDTVVDETDPDNVVTTPGIVNGGGEYDPGDSVTITAIPAEGYRFDSWTIVGVDDFTDLTLNEQTFTMPKGNVYATAKFVKQWTVVFKSYDGEVLSTQIVDNGSSAVAPDAPSRSGYSFTGWEPTPSDANYLNVTCDMELVATYSRKTYTITAYAGSNGTITPSGNVSVSYGSSKRFNISPNNGYKILDVTVDGESVGAVTTYLFENVTSNHTIYVTFTEDNEYELEGEWYYDNIEVEEGNVEYVFRSRETLDANEDASAVLIIESLHRVNVSFDYILNGRTDAMFGFTINGEPFRIIESSDTWTEFNETFEPVDGKIVIGLTYSKGENPTEDEDFLDLAAIKNLVVE